jgi:hypothetical protein
MGILQIFILTFFLIGACFARTTTLTAIHDVPGEAGAVTFRFTDNVVVQERKTNTISKSQELWFGITKPNRSAEARAVRASLEKVSEKLQRVDNFLMDEKGEGRNAFLEAPAHGLRFTVNGQTVLPGSRAFTEVEPLFKKLDALKWTLDKGITVARENLKVMDVSGGKKSDSKKNLTCTQQNAHQSCMTSGFGPIILE